MNTSDLINKKWVVHAHHFELTVVVEQRRWAFPNDRHFIYEACDEANAFGAAEGG